MVPSITERLRSVRGPDREGWYTALCPFHNDREHPNLRVNERGFTCMACGEAGNIGDLAARLGLGTRQRFDDRVVATYDYCDENGVLAFQTVRLDRPKDFRQRRPDGGGGWIWDLKGVRLVPYLLPEVLSAERDRTLFVVEGEKDANRLWAESVPATTNPMGAGKWRNEYSEFLHGRAIVVISDNDDPGRRHAAQVARSLDGVAAKVRVLELPDLPERGDVSDWFDAGGTADELLQLAAAVPVCESSPADTDEAAPDPPRTDAGNGELFASLYGDRVRYDHRRRHWLVWDGHCWVEDCDGQVRRLAKLAARHRYIAAPGIDDLNARSAVAKFAIQSENRQRLDAMLAQAQSEPPVSDPGSSWNGDPWLLGVTNGVLDLRSGLLRRGRHDDRITMRAGITFDAAASCARWMRFLDEVFRGDAELIDFIQRAVGYSLTGITSEQCMFLCYGKGANGKSVLLAVLRAIAGSYAYNAPFSLFEIHGRSAIPNDLAALVGRRLVTSSETNEGTRLNEARIKALTGCDPITARFLHGEFFTFDPLAKYWLAVNHKPTVADDSHGFWRRVQLIPFLRQFSEEEADQHLVDSLLDELPGILAWAVEGAQEWCERGLGAPPAVRRATETYRIESDPLAAFIDQCCVEGDGLSVASSQAYKAYKGWAYEQGMGDREMLNSTLFGTRMSAKFERRHTKRGNAYDGVGLLSDRPESDEVKGSVKGSESEHAEDEVFALENHLAGDNTEKPFTTLHPFTTNIPERPHCRRCLTETSPTTQSNLCDACRSDALRSVVKGQV